MFLKGHWTLRHNNTDFNMDLCYRYTSNKAIMVSTVQDNKTISYISIIIHGNNFTQPFAATLIVQLKKHWYIYSKTI